MLGHLTKKEPYDMANESGILVLAEYTGSQLCGLSTEMLGAARRIAERPRRRGNGSGLRQRRYGLRQAGDRLRRRRRHRVEERVSTSTATTRGRRP